MPHVLLWFPLPLAHRTQLWLVPFECLCLQIQGKKEVKTPGLRGMVRKMGRKRWVLVAKKNRVLYNPACAKIKIEMTFKMACVITIN